MTDNASVPATGIVAGAMPVQTSPAPPAAATPPDAPATGDALGDPGKKALDAMKAERNAAVNAAKAAEAELEKLRLTTATDFEKAIAAARKEGADTVIELANAKVRRSEVRAALATAGINASVLDLATKADEFAALKVNDTGEVEGLADAIKAFKTAKADLFKAPVAPASADGGNRTGDKEPAKDLRSSLEQHYAPK